MLNVNIRVILYISFSPGLQLTVKQVYNLGKSIFAELSTQLPSYMVANVKLNLRLEKNMISDKPVFLSEVKILMKFQRTNIAIPLPNIAN